MDVHCITLLIKCINIHFFRQFESWKATAIEWIGDRADALMPAYIRGLVSLFLNGDRRVSEMVSKVI